jgi:hypothetical protein
MASAMDFKGSNLDFLGWSHYYFFQAAPQLYSRGWVDPVPDPILNLVVLGIEPRTSGSIARNSDHKTTVAVLLNDIFTKHLN